MQNDETKRWNNFKKNHFHVRNNVWELANLIWNHSATTFQTKEAFHCQKKKKKTLLSRWAEFKGVQIADARTAGSLTVIDHLIDILIKL